MPAFYPKITLASGIHLKLAGGTLVSFAIAPPGAASGAASGIREVPVIDITYGKVVLVNTANDENDLQLKLGTTASTFASAAMPRWLSTWCPNTFRAETPGNRRRRSSSCLCP